jgi:hypothetical protein
MADNAGWLDYFTPIDFQSSNDILISHRPSDDEFEEDELLTRAK